MLQNIIVLILVPVSIFAAPADSKPDLKIVGGSDAPQEEFIYQVSFRRNYDDAEHFCGGVILSEEWILTAAQCVASFAPQLFIIIVGSNRLSTGGQTYSALEVHPHPLFNPFSLRHDVALVKVPPIWFNNDVGPIAIETESFRYHEEFILSGWGRLSYPGAMSDKLQQIVLQSTSIEYCRSKFPLVIDQQMCTLNREGGGACIEDTGGALVRNVDGVKKLVGILSYGTPCAQGIPDVSSQIHPYISWIKRKCENCI